MATKKFKCKVCGYVHEGDKAPATCPVCQAPASQFEEIKEAKKGLDRDSNVYQKKNEDNDKRQQILRSINVTVPANEAEAKYNELIKEAFLVDANGQKVEGDAFEGEVANAYPVFVANVDGQTKYIMALHGTGLWGPLWGYLSVNDDKNTVYGADFSHQGETPGLGAEITKPAFSSQFAGKQIFKDGTFKSIAVVKHGKTAEGQDYVDGISGGTITSQGVSKMLFDSLTGYEKFLTSKE